MSTIGFVVLEYNQAGGQPSIPDFAELHQERADAETDRNRYADASRRAYRKDRYVIATLEVEDDGD